jgi:oligogalacturonide transporter
MKTRKIGLANYLAYGSGDFLGAGTTALTAAWLLYFYTTFCGLSPIEATFIFAARVLDAVVSPLMGFLTDNSVRPGSVSALVGVSSLSCWGSRACSATR